MSGNAEWITGAIARVMAAARCTVEASADGYVRHGAALGKAAGTLRNELTDRGPESRAKLGLADALRLMHASGDVRTLHAMALEFDHVAIPLPVVASATSCAETVAAMAVEFGELISVYSLAVQDNRVTNNELAKVIKAWGELLVAGKALINDASARNAALQRSQGAALSC